MKTKFIVMAAMAAMFSMGFTACSNNDEDLTSKMVDSQNVISFKAAGDNAIVTRGYALNAGNVGTTLPNFQTWGYDDSTDGLYMGASATVGVNVANADENTDGVYENTWSYAPPQFWPVNALNFVALAPAAPNGVTSTSTASATNVVTLTTGVTLSTTVSDQDDIMFAEADGITKATDDGNVPYTFKHALSQIVFKGKFDGLHAISKVTIAEIALGGINKTGTLVFNSEGNFYGGTALSPVTKPASVSTPAVFSLAAGELEESVWNENTVLTPAELYTAADEAENPEHVEGTVKTPAVLQGTTPFDLTVSNNASKKNAWMLLPQSVTAWDGTSYTAGVPTSGAYIKLRVKLEKYNSATDSYVTIKNNAEEDAIYLPLTINWDRSTRYIYTIEFNGENALDPITFSVAAEPWTDADPQPGIIEY